MNISKHDNKIINATELLMDNDMEKILLGTYEKCKCAPELSEMYGIPTVTCFKKIKILKKRGLLRVTEVVRNSNGKSVEYYTANLENAYVFYDSGRIKVRFTVVLQMADDFRKRFQRATGISRGYNDSKEDNQA